VSRFVLTAQLQLQAPNNVAQVVQQIQNQLQNVQVNVQVQGVQQAARQTRNLAQNLDQATDSATRLGRVFAVSVRRFTALAVATRAVSLLTNTLSGAIQEAIDFERELIKVSQVTGRAINELRDLTDEITNLSTRFGVASRSLLEVTTILAQAGLSANDTKIALETLAKSALAPNFDSLSETTEGAIAILAQFKQGVGALEAQLGSIDAVAGAFAVEAGDLIDVIRRAGGVFKSSGGSLNELIALFTSVRATTRESAESIGTGLRTIFTRIQRPKTIEFLKQFGVELVDLNGKFVGPFEAVRRLSDALAGLGEGDLTFIRIAEELGGFRQIGKVLPLLQQFTLAQQALNVAQEGGAGLTKNAESAQAALAIRIMKVKEEFLALVRSITETSSFQIMANTALNLASALIKIGDALKPVLPLLTALAAIKVARGLGSFLGGLGSGLGSARGFNQGGKVLAFAKGGLVPGSGNRDTVPAMLTPGEFVMKKSAVQSMGASTLKSMNQNRFRKGGPVPIKITGDSESTPIIGQIAPTGTPGIKKTKKVKTTLGDAGVSPQGKETTKTQAILQANVKNITLGEESGPFSYDEVVKPGLQFIDEGIKMALQSIGIKKQTQKLSNDQAAQRSISGYAFETFASSLLGQNAEGGSSDFDFINPSPALSKYTKTEPIPRLLDAKNTLVQASAIAQKALGYKKRNPSGIQFRRANVGGTIQKFATGGLVEESEVGSAIFDNVGFSSDKKVLVKRQDIESKLNKTQRLADNYPIKSQKQYTLQTEGLSANTYKEFRSTVENQLVAAADNSAKQLSVDLGARYSPIPAEAKTSFLRGINAGSYGNLFEDTLKVMAGPPFTTDPGRSFDFPRGVSGLLKDDYKNLTATYVDAKSSLAESSVPKFQTKVANQLATEAQALGLTRQENADEEKSRKGAELKAAFGTRRKFFGGKISKFAVGGKAKDTLEKYYKDSSSFNVGLANSRSLDPAQRKQLAADVKDLRSLRTPAPPVLYSSISRIAFDRMAQQVGLNKTPDVPEGTKYRDIEGYYNKEAQQIVGRSFSLPGFVSTSKNFAKAKLFLDNAPRSEDKWAAMMTIQTKKNAQGVDVVEQLKDRKITNTQQAINPRTGQTETFYMQQPSEEEEVMLPPRSRFKVQKSKYVSLFGSKNLWMDVQQFKNGGMPLVDDIPNATGTIPPRPSLAIARLLQSGGGAVDIDRTIKRTVGDKAYGSARTDAQRNAALQTYFKDDAARLRDVKTAPLTQFGQELQSIIKSGKLDGRRVSIISKSKRVPGIAEYLSQLFGIPTANMVFTSGASKEPAMEAIRTKGPRVDRVRKFFGGEIQRFAQGGQPKYTWAENKSFYDRANAKRTWYDVFEHSDQGGAKVVYRGSFDDVFKFLEQKKMQQKAMKASSAQPQKFASGGVVPGSGNRDTVPAVLQQGDFVIRKSSVKKIGTENLASMAGYATGGGVDKSVPALLTPGEFVFSKSQAQSIGYGKLNRMNKVGKYATGGAVGVQKFASGTSGSGARLTTAQILTAARNSAPSNQNNDNNSRIALSQKIDEERRKIEKENILKLRKVYTDSVDEIKKIHDKAVKDAQAAGKSQAEIADITKKANQQVQQLNSVIRSQAQAARSGAATQAAKNLKSDPDAVFVRATQRAQRGEALSASTQLGRDAFAKLTTAQLKQIDALQKATVASQRAAAGDNADAQSSLAAAQADRAEAAASSKTSSMFGGLGGGITLVSSTLSAMLPSLDESSSMFTRLGHSVLSMVTVLGSVIFTLEAFGISLKKQAALNFLTGQGLSPGALQGLFNTIANAAGPSVAKVITFVAGGLIRIAGPAATVAATFMVVKSAANAVSEALNDFTNRLNQAIQRGDTVDAGNIAVERTRSQNSNAAGAGAAAGAVAGFILGGFNPIGAAIGAVVGDVIVRIFADSETAAEASAIAQAQLNKTTKSLSEAQTATQQTLKDFENGVITAKDALAQINVATQEANVLQQKTGEAVKANVDERSTGFGARARNIAVMLGGGLMGMELSTTRNRRLDTENAKFINDQQQAILQANQLRQQGGLAVAASTARSAVAAGKNEDEIRTEVMSQLERDGITPSKLRQQAMQAYQASSSAFARGDESTGNALQAQGDAFKKQADEYKKSVDNVIKEQIRVQKALEALNLGLRGPAATAGAAAAELEYFAAQIEGTALPAVGALNLLQSAATAAGQAIDQNTIKQATDEVVNVLQSLGASQSSIDKFKANAEAFNVVQTRYNSVTKKIAEEQKKSGKQFSAEDIRRRLAEELGDGLPQEIKDIINGIELTDTVKKEFENLNFSGFGEAIGAEAEKFFGPVGKIIQDYQKAQQVLVNVTKQRIEAERNYIQSVKEAQDIMMEGRDIQAKYGGRAVTIDERRASVLAKANASNSVTGLSPLKSANLNDVNARSNEIRRRYLNNENAINAGAGRGTAAGEQLRQQQQDLKQAQKDQVQTIRELIKLEEENLKLIAEKNKLERDSLDSLLSGDIEKFFEQQAAVGATAAIASGDTRLASMFGGQALGMAAQDIRRQQEAGVQTLYGRNLAGAGGLTETGFGMAFNAAGFTDPRLAAQSAQVAAGTTAEEEASKATLRGLGGALSAAGQIGADLAQIDLNTATMNVQTAEINLQNVIDRGKAAGAMATGGLVYANKGMFINFKPRGTDTVPAMLTPGEFVVRREAVNRGNNLQLLKAINSGSASVRAASAEGFADGGTVQYFRRGSRGSVQNTQNFAPASVNTGIDTEALTRFSTALDNFNQQLSKNITSLQNTKFQIALSPTNINVNLTGTSFLANLTQTIKQDLITFVGEEIRNYAIGNDGKLRRSGSTLGTVT